MSKVIIYTKENCPYCTRAKLLFNQKNIEYEEIDITGNDDKRNELVEKSGGRTTLPQIFIDDKHIGGCDDLYKLHEEGKL